MLYSDKEGDYMATEAQRRAVRKYDAANTVQVHLKLNLKNDADILEWMSKQKTVQGAIKQLIRDKIKTDWLSDRLSELKDEPQND